MLVGIVTVFTTFIFTGILGRYIGIHFAKREHMDKSQLNQVQKEINLIEEINLCLIKESTLRKYAAENLIFNIQETNQLNEDITKYREVHQQTIKDWMISLNQNNILLTGLGLNRIAEEIEEDIHARFNHSRFLLNKVLENKKSEHSINQILEDARRELSLAFGATRRISKKLVKIKENKWDDFIKNKYNTLPFDKTNVSKASIWILFIALFYRVPNTLRVPRSHR